MAQKIGLLFFYETYYRIACNEVHTEPKCACAHDESALHGPYNRWTRKVKCKTVTRTLTDKQAKICRECINNYRNLKKIIEEMRELSMKYIEEQK